MLDINHNYYLLFQLLVDIKITSCNFSIC